MFLQVHQNVLPIREGKQGWIHHFAPDGICFHDNAKVFADIVSISLLFTEFPEGEVAEVLLFCLSV